MRQKTVSRRHSIEILFPIILFLVFAVTSIAVILFAARSYKRQVERSDADYEIRTSLEYLMQKVHQSDTEGGVLVTTFHGQSALLLKDTESEGSYCTYIYCDGSALRELYMRSGANIGPEAGTEVLPLSGFTAEQISEHLIRLTCTDENNRTDSTLVAVRSGD